MKTFQYQILRYLPDRISGEFINLGVVIYQREMQVLLCKFYTKSTRLHSFFPSVNAKNIVSNIKAIQVFIGTLAKSMQSPLFHEMPATIDEITKRILPTDDSALFFTEPAKVLDINADSLLNGLYQRIVLKYIQEQPDSETLADKEVWKTYYKTYFDKYQLTEFLKPVIIETKFDSWDFERTCKNGALHCFESVSFELMNPESIKRKVYTWAGKIEELKSAEEQIHVYLLSALPQQAQLQQFIKEKLSNVQSGKAIVELVDTDNADQIAKQVKDLMEAHN